MSEEIKWKYVVRGVGIYSQTNSKWAEKDYAWDSLTGEENNWAHLGCSLTALTNVLYWGVKGVNPPTPLDVNNRNEKFFSAFEKVYFKCLQTGKKLWFGGRGGTDNQLIYDGGTFTSPISVSSINYTYILQKTRKAISIGHPVLLSYMNCNDQNGSFNHSVVAVGVDIEDHIYFLEVYGEQTAYIERLKNGINITPCKTLYKAYECIRK